MARRGWPPLRHLKTACGVFDLFRAESILLRSYWVLVVMDVYTRRIVGFGVEAANLDGIRVCRNSGSLSVERCLRVRCAIAWLNIRFHRWRANLRVLEVDEIKTLPGTPRSHAFIERLIGTIRREFLDRALFWGQGDLERKLKAWQAYYNQHRCHTALAGLTPAQRSSAQPPPTARLDSYRWRRHCYGLFQTAAAA